MPIESSSGASAKARLLRFILGTLVLLAAAEGLSRLQHQAFAAAAHRARFKAELLKGQPAPAFAAIGTSRFNDSVSPRQMARALAEHGGPTLAGFNASVPSSSLQTQAFLAGVALERQVGTVFLEASPRQLDFLADESLQEAPAPAGFEEQVLSWSELLHYRRALVAENLPRLAALFAPARFDGSEWFRTRSLAQWWSETDERPTPLPPPEVICPGTPATGDPAYSAALEVWARLSQQAQANMARIYFVVPPVASANRAEECDEHWRAFWGALANRTHRPVISFACTGAPDELFHDRFNHMNWRGRAALSEALAVAWAADLEKPRCEGRP